MRTEAPTAPRHVIPPLVFSFGLAALLALGAVLFAAEPQTLSPRMKLTVAALKSAAEEKGSVTRIPQGAFYFKWLSSPPPEWDKAYFKLGELSKGTRFLSLQLVKKGSGGLELLVLNDVEVNGAPEEAYRSTGKNLPDADKNLNANFERSKTPVTAEMIHLYKAMLDQLNWELSVTR